jgi:ketosteroid isomerase-like protein
MIPDATALAGTESFNVTEEQMALDMTRTDDGTQIRGLLDGWVKAVRASDIERIMAAYAPDILSFDAIAQLQFKGEEAYRKHWEACLTMCAGPVIFEIHDLGIEAGDGVAFAHYLLRCGGTGPDGKQQVGWMRVTVCCRRTNGRWVVAHEHFSVPFDMESGKALLGLEPQNAAETRAA